MSGPQTRVFIARLADTAVFDPIGDPVGRVRDVVVTLRLGREAPRVLGLVVEVAGRRRIFLPMTRVTSIDSGQVISTGLVNMRRFEQRPTETLVLGELLDRKVTLLEDGTTVTVEDVGIEQQRTRDWAVSRVFVRRAGKGLRRRGEAFTVDWDQVSGFALAEDGQGAANLLATFAKMNVADLATVLHELSPKRRAEVAAALDDERLADVLEAMQPDDAADLLSELPRHEAEKFLELMEPDEAAPLRRLLEYSDDSAGGMMTTEPVILPPDATVAEALARVRQPELSPALAAQVYICRPPMETPTGRFIGIAHIQRLLREPPSSLVSGVVDTRIVPLQPNVSLAEITHHLATYNLVAVPVVDENNHLLGAVTVDDVLDHLLPEDWRESDRGVIDSIEVPEGGRDGT
ncbi:MAG: magnesium transporter MgtE N-terminal domain-containing protein [Actinomycetes bacterium]